MPDTSIRELTWEGMHLQGDIASLVGSRIQVINKSDLPFFQRCILLSYTRTD